METDETDNATHLGDPNEANEARRGCGGKVRKEEAPDDADRVDGPNVRALPLALAFPAERARKSKKTECKCEVAQRADKRAGERESPRERHGVG